jgi:hypothetical protein
MMSRGIKVFFIQKGWMASVEKVKIMPQFEQRKVRWDKPLAF